jgi:GNAT superfamily N-acetyltransferase
MIEIQCLNKHQLTEFVHSDQFRKLPNLPISAHRAASQARNPRAGEEDILLLLAWLNGELVGYLGVLPDRYFVDDHQSYPCGWLSCLWVSEAHRGQSIAKLLVSRSVETMGGRLLITEFTHHAKQLYDKLGLFSDLKINTGIRLYRRLELHRLLPPKHPFFKKISPLLRLTDALGNTLIKATSWLRKPQTPKLKWEIIEKITPDIQRFIAGKQQNELFRRGQNDLNWALQYPWIHTGHRNDSSNRYYFSSVDHSFDFIGLKVCDADMNPLAFLLFSKRNHTLKLPYAYFSNNLTPQIATIIDFHLHLWNIKTFTTFHPQLVKYYQSTRTAAIHKKNLKRHYIATNRMTESLEEYNFQIQDGDGDCLFT